MQQNQLLVVANSVESGASRGQLGFHCGDVPTAGQVVDHSAKRFCGAKEYAMLLSSMVVPKPDPGCCTELSSSGQGEEEADYNHQEELILTRLVVDYIHTQLSTTLVSVHLANCNLDDTFAVSFAEHRSWPALQELDLHNNAISDAGSMALTTHLATPHLTTLDLSHNRLTTVAILHLVEQPAPCLRALRHLRLADVQQLLPVRVFQQYARALESNYYCLQELTLGSEILQGQPHSAAAAAPQEWDEMDAMLRYWWQEPSFRAATRRIRLLLRLNYGRAEGWATTGGDPIGKLRWITGLFEANDEVDVVYLVLKEKPSLLGELAEAAAAS